MSDNPEWRTLPVPSTKDPPSLLCRFSKASSGFSLIVTDLLQLWKSESTKQQILQQAAEAKSSIDPNEDPSQYEVLLSKIQSAISGAKGTTLSFRRSVLGQPGSFFIRAYMSLPAPLRPLTWEFSLQLYDQKTFSQEVLLPTLDAQEELHQQIQSLKKVIAEKDAAVGKLLDKMEGSAMDLSVVFPGLVRSGKRGLSPQQAAKSVPGLSKFNEEDWSRGFRSSEQGAHGLVEGYRTMSSQKQGFSGRQRPTTCEDHPNWAMRISTDYADIPSEIFGESSRGQAPQTQPGSDPEETATDGDDDFERQETPPKGLETHDGLQPKPRSATSHSSASRSPSHLKATQAKKECRIGRLGGKATYKAISKSREQSESPELSPSSQTSKSSESPSPGTHDIEPSSESDDDAQPQSNQDEKRTEKRPKLGVIGGQKKTQTLRRSATPSEPVTTRNSTAATHTNTRRKLGNIGGHKEPLPERNTVLPDQEIARPRTSHAEEHTTKRVSASQAKTETEEEKANRKRNELKMQLEHAPLAKKKRRF